MVAALVSIVFFLMLAWNQLATQPAPAITTTTTTDAKADDAPRSEPRPAIRRVPLDAVELKAPARAAPGSSSSSCEPWGCTCQGASDRYGVWHYKGFGAATAAAHEWWLQSKCRSRPAAGSAGWATVGLIKRWKFSRYRAELARRVAKLAADEPASARRRVNERMPAAREDKRTTARVHREVCLLTFYRVCTVRRLAAVRDDYACFTDPAWPRASM